MFNSLRQSLYFAGIFLVAFLLSIILLLKLPGNLNQSCVIGAYFNMANILYNLLISFLIAYSFSNILEFGSNKKINSSMVGVFTWLTTTFCVPCIIPIASLLGFSVSLNFFAYSNIWFKIFTICVLTYGAFESSKLELSKCKDQDCSF